MPAAGQESSLSQGGRVLGVVAGGGVLPQRLLQACDSQNIKTFVIGFKGQTDPQTYDGRRHMVSRLGAAGSIVKALKQNQAMDLVLIGSLQRPGLTDLRPDLFTAKFFARIGLRALGDDGLLKAVRRQLEKEGFTLHGVHEFVQDLLMPEGTVGKNKPNDKQRVDIDRGIDVSQAIGRLDVGQAVIIHDGVVLGVEGVEGTDALIRRCAGYRKGGKGGILVKTCKPQQDRDLDMPTVGPDTLRICAEHKMAGIAVHAGNSLLIDPAEVARLADKEGLFVLGVSVDGAKSE